MTRPPRSRTPPPQRLVLSYEAYVTDPASARERQVPIEARLMHARLTRARLPSGSPGREHPERQGEPASRLLASRSWRATRPLRAARVLRELDRAVRRR